MVRGFNHRGAKAFSGARVTNSAGQSIGNTTDTLVEWPAEDYDTATYHDGVTNNTRLTAPKDGYYRIGCLVQWASNSSGQRWLRYRVNGGALVLMSNRDSVAGGTEQSFSDELHLNAGDYVEFSVRQDTGGSLSVTGHATISFIGD